MVEALVGTVIALVATGALALMAEIVAFSPSTSSRTLTPYEKMLVDRVYIEKPGNGEPKVAEWLQQQEVNHPRSKLRPMEDR